MKLVNVKHAGFIIEVPVQRTVRIPFEDIWNMFRDGVGKIEMIKSVRVTHGLSLAEAKRTIEFIAKIWEVKKSNA